MGGPELKFSDTQPPAVMQKLNEVISQKVAAAPAQAGSEPGEASLKVAEIPLQKSPAPQRLTTWEWFLELAFKNPMFYGYLVASVPMILAGLGFGSEDNLS